MHKIVTAALKCISPMLRNPTHAGCLDDARFRNMNYKAAHVLITMSLVVRESACRWSRDKFLLNHNS